MIDERLKQIIKHSSLVLATVGKEGRPHGIIVGAVRVVSKNQLLITDNYMVETIKNIEKNPRVALIVQDKKKGYEMRGTADYSKKGKWFELVRKMPENKGEPCKGAIVVTVEKIKNTG